MNPEQKLKEMGVELPKPATPVANYVPAVRAGSLVFVSGHGPRTVDGKIISGKVGKDLTTQEGYEAAKRVAIGLLGSLKGEIGDLGKVKRIVKVLGMVNAVENFTDHPKVINGCSDFFVQVFGEAAGKHARSAVGMGSLPFNIPVEIEVIVEVVD